MTAGYVLISVAPAEEQGVEEALAAIDEITELYSLFGPYDIIAKVEVKNEDRLAEVVLERIRPIGGVADTKTHTVVPPEQIAPGQETPGV